MSIHEFTKEQIVLLFFLTHGNEWTNADTIVHWVNGEESQNCVGVLNDSNLVPFTLSRAGAVKICKRLVPSVLDSMTTTGYRSKKVLLYRLAENESGYFAVIERLKHSLLIFQKSEYGTSGVEKYLMKAVHKKNEVDFDGVQDIVIWAFQHSPTALLLAVEGDLLELNHSIDKTPSRNLSSCMVTLACAIRVDAVSTNRNELLKDKKEIDFFESLLNATPNFFQN